MALRIGNCEAVIVKHCVRDFGGKAAVQLWVRTDDGTGAEVLIFLTDKSMNMARAQLKKCGFDVDSRELEELDMSPTLLAGTSVPIVVDEYKGKLQARIAVGGGSPVKPDAFKGLTAALRAAKNNRTEGPSFADEVPPPSDDDIPF